MHREKWDAHYWIGEQNLMNRGPENRCQRIKAGDAPQIETPTKPKPVGAMIEGRMKKAAPRWERPIVYTQ